MKIEIIADGVAAFRCESREALMFDVGKQTELRNWRDGQRRLTNQYVASRYLCGTCRLPVSLVEKNGLIYPASFPGQHALHALGCGTVGNGSHGSNSVAHPGAKKSSFADKTSVIERAFDEVYFAQCAQTPTTTADFCERLRESLSARLEQAGLRVRVGLTNNALNTKNESADSPEFVLVKTNMGDGITKEERWTLSGVDLDVRTGRCGGALPGSHVIFGAWDQAEVLRILHAWPVHLNKTQFHVRHSLLEDRLMTLLDDAGVRYIKPPSAPFMKNDFGALGFSNLAERIVKENMWPDFLVQIADGWCLVEVAGLKSLDYRAVIVRKMIQFAEWEQEFGLQWAILVSQDEQLIIDSGSLKLDLAATLTG